MKEEHPESFGHFSDTCLILGERTFTEISKAGYSTRNEAITCMESSCNTQKGNLIIISLQDDCLQPLFSPGKIYVPKHSTLQTCFLFESPKHDLLICRFLIPLDSRSGFPNHPGPCRYTRGLDRIGKVAVETALGVSTERLGHPSEIKKKWWHNFGGKKIQYI